MQSQRLNGNVMMEASLDRRVLGLAVVTEKKIPKKIPFHLSRNVKMSRLHTPRSASSHAMTSLHASILLRLTGAAAVGVVTPAGHASARHAALARIR